MGDFVFAQVPADPAGVPTPKWTVPIQPAIKPVSAAKRLAACKKYEGMYIGHYGDVYKVENCHRRKVTSSDFLFDLTRSKQHIEVVGNDPISVIPEGKEIGDRGLKGTGNRTCKELEGRFVTFSYSDIFVIEKCKLREFPDFMTFQEAQNKRTGALREILAISLDEMQGMPMGNPLSSQYDEVLKRLQGKDDAVEIIPIDEACKDLDGTIVTFQSRVYRLEKCHKREYNNEQFSQDRANHGLKITELTPTQWLSLPDGRPFPTKTQAEPTPTKND